MNNIPPDLLPYLGDPPLGDRSQPGATDAGVYSNPGMAPSAMYPYTPEGAAAEAQQQVGSIPPPPLPNQAIGQAALGGGSATGAPSAPAPGADIFAGVGSAMGGAGGAASALPGAIPSGAPRPGGGAPGGYSANGTIADLKKAYSTQQAGLQEQGSAEAAQAGIRAKGELDAAQEDRASLGEIQAAQQKAANDARQRTMEIVQQGQELANKQIDPAAVYHNMDTPTRIIAALSLFAGGYIQPKTGHNPAAEMIEKQIQNDIDAQKANMENQWRALGLKKDLYNELNTQDQQSIDFMDKLRVAKYQSAINMTNALADQQNDPIIKGRYLQASGALQEKLVTQVDQIHARQVDQSQKAAEIAQRWKIAQLQSATELKKTEMEVEGRNAASKAALEGKAAEQAIPLAGPGVVATNKDSADSLNNSLTSASKVIGLAQEIRDLRQQMGVSDIGVLPTAFRTRLSQKLNGAQAIFEGALGMGTGDKRFSEALAKNLMAKIGNANTPGELTAALQEVQDMTELSANYELAGKAVGWVGSGRYWHAPVIQRDGKRGGLLGDPDPTGNDGGDMWQRLAKQAGVAPPK